MAAPQFLIGAALAFWGWQIGFLWLGLLAAGVLEGARAARWQWDLAEADYHRVWDLCSVIFLGLFSLIYTSEEVTKAANLFVRWLPLVFYPAIAAQWFGPREKLSYRMMSWLARLRKHSPPATEGLNISYLYFALCLFGASTTMAVPRTNASFYLGFCGLMAWALASIRPRRFSAGVWATLLVVVAGMGYVTQRQLPELQNALESQLGSWVVNLFRREPDTRESRTSIGQIGKLKLSGRIVLRVETDGRHQAPELLRQASYTIYKQTVWYGTARDYGPVTAETNDAWNLLPRQKSNGRVTIAGYLRRGRGVLALPLGTARIEKLPSQEMETNRLGVVRVVNGPAFIQFLAQYGPGPSIDSEPGEDDRAVPSEDQAGVSRIADELHLAEKPYAEKLRALSTFFQEKFQYSTYLNRPSASGAPPSTPMSDFLLRQRSGHCEYFATATVFLLRQAGIPARYATGYSVQESTSKTRYVVRERHAHAWCLAWNEEKKNWEDLDTTPAGWNTVEAEQASFFQPVGDLFSRLWFEFSKWRYGKSNWRQYLIWLLIPLAMVLAWRLIFKKSRKTKLAPAASNNTRLTLAGEDSEFYLIEQRLSILGLTRERGETMLQWLKRIETSLTAPVTPLEPIILLHYRYRFDPKGLSNPERAALKNTVAQWLESFGTNSIA